MEEGPIEPEQPLESGAPAPYVCPNCGTSIEPSTVSGPVIECPQCKTQFFAPVPEDRADAEDEKELIEKDREAELSALHIKAAATIRRTAYRERSYYIVAVAACSIILIQLVINVSLRIHSEHRVGATSAGYLLFALALFMGAEKFTRRALEVHRRIKADIRARELEEMELSRNPPDLSALSDGSQQAKNLEKMFEPDGEQ